MVKIISKLLLFTLLISFASYSQDEHFKTIKFGNQVWSSSDINLPIDKELEIILDNGERLYSKGGAELVANSIEGWRLPTNEDVEELRKHFDNDDKKIFDALKMKNHYGREGKYYDGDKEIKGAFWTSSENPKGNGEVRNYSFLVMERNGEYRVDLDYSNDDFYFSVRLIKE